jgi:hypothetical protein
MGIPAEIKKRKATHGRAINHQTESRRVATAYMMNPANSNRRVISAKATPTYNMASEVE